MALAKVLVLVLAGGAGSRLGPLTQGRAKPAVPFGGSFRLIDFPLSSCQHSHTPDVWVVDQFNPASLADHLANGRPWDLDRGAGGLLVLHPHRGGDRGGWHSGTADALWRQAALIREFAPEVLLVLSADAVYRCDYRDVADAHLASGASVTMVTSEVNLDEAVRYGVVETDHGRVTGYAHKPDQPRSTTVTTEIFAFDPEALLATLEELADQLGEDDLEDLGDHGLPQLVDAGTARAVPLGGYWQDVGTIEAYWQAHMDLLADDPPFDLHDSAWPIHTQGARSDGALLGHGSQVSRSLVSPGCRIDGQVDGSVLSPGVVVEAGAVVRDSVLLDDVVVRAGAVLRRAVVDSGARVGRGARVGGEGDVAVVGQDHELADGDRVGPGEQRPEPEG